MCLTSVFLLVLHSHCVTLCCRLTLKNRRWNVQDGRYFSENIDPLKPFPFHVCHLGKWQLATDSYSVMTPGRPGTVEIPLDRRGMRDDDMLAQFKYQILTAQNSKLTNLSSVSTKLLEVDQQRKNSCFFYLTLFMFFFLTGSRFPVTRPVTMLPDQIFDMLVFGQPLSPHIW